MDKIVMLQVESLLQNLEKGESAKQIAKEEKRRAKRELLRTKQKPLKFSKPEELNSEVKSKKKLKRKANNSSGGVAGLDNLTMDEKMAVELYQVIKKSKNNEDLDDDEVLDDNEFDSKIVESEDEIPKETNTYNDVKDTEQDEEEEKRAITYKIAKNKGLMPKRSKLQRNPRVKNRMKFEKAKKRRKGAVREVRDQNHKYSGEASGLNVRVKKGVKIK